MEVTIVLNREQLEALLRWQNGGDDPTNPEGTDIVLDANEISSIVEQFLTDELARI